MLHNIVFSKFFSIIESRDESINLENEWRNKKMDDLKGFITYNDENYQFSYSKAILNLYPQKRTPVSLGELFSQFERGQEIRDIELKGKTSRGNNIIFEVSEQCSNEDGFLSFNVYSIYEYDPQRFHRVDGTDKKYTFVENQIRGLRIYGIDVDCFYPPERAYALPTLNDDNLCALVGVKKIKPVPLGNIIWDNIELSFSLQYSVTQSFAAMPLKSKSMLIVEFSQSVELAYVKEIYYVLCQLFQYLVRRNNVVFDNVETFDIDENSLKRNFGNFYDLRRNEVAETHKKVKNRVISYDYIKENFPELLKPFLEGKMYVDNIPDCLDKVNQYRPDRMLFDFVAFEREYANLYPEIAVRSQEYSDAKIIATDALDDAMKDKSGKRLKYLKTFKKRILADENSLSDRLIYTIEDCKDIMRPFLVYELGVNYNIPEDEITPLENIASKMNTLRNDMAHGNLDIHIEREHIAGFAIIEFVLYAMRLKHIGVADNNIQGAIAQLMGINISLDEKE